MIKRGYLTLLAALLALAAAAPTAYAQSVEIRQKDGTKWRGAVNDPIEVVFRQQGVDVTLVGQLVRDERLFIVVRGLIAGETRDKTIFKGDIVSVRTTEAASVPSARKEATARPSTSSAKRSDSSPADARLGVFVLPLKGMVGEAFRHEEIEAIGKEADKYGPGQIIVLVIDSGGGLMVEIDPIHETILDIKRRHRLVAWIKSAISAAAATAIGCDEIYFMTEGTLGGMTAFNLAEGSLKGEQLDYWMNMAGDLMESGGRSRHIAHAMINAPALLSYTKDPETGAVTWFDDRSGDVLLSDEQSNLVFTSVTAMDSKFADGVADTEAELAKLLDLPEWHEVSDHGRRMAADWQRTVERAKEEIPRLIARRDYKSSAGSAEERIGALIQINKQLIQWWNRCPNVARMSLPPKEVLEREIEELRKQLADMRGNG